MSQEADGMTSLLKLVASVALLSISGIFAIFAAGSWTRFGQHWGAFLLAAFACLSCLWAIGLLWKRVDVRPATARMPSTDFEVWLAQRIVARTDLSEQQITELRDEYQQEFGGR